PGARPLRVLRDQLDPHHLVPARLQRSNHLAACAAVRQNQTSWFTVLARRRQQHPRKIPAEIDRLQRGVTVLRRALARTVAKGADTLRDGLEVFEPSVSFLPRHLGRIKKPRSTTLIAACRSYTVDSPKHSARVIGPVLTAATHSRTVATLRVEQRDRTIIYALPRLDRLHPRAARLDEAPVHLPSRV